MGSLSIGHWLVVLLIIMLVFGTKKLGNMGADFGKAIKGFKDGIKDDGASGLVGSSSEQPAKLPEGQ